MQNQGDGLATAFEQRLEKWFGTIGGHAEEIALPLLEKDPALAGKEAKADDLIIAMILDQLGIDRWDGELRDLYQAQYLEVAKAASDVAERAGLGASLPDVVARSILAAGGRRAGLVDLAGQTKDALFQALAEGPRRRRRCHGAGQPHRRDGRSWPQRHAADRSRRIARTETKYAQNISTIERAKAAGVTSLIVYDGLLGPGRSLLTHIARNGSIVSIAEALTMADEEHPNGTLSFAPNFED
jgi:hypothetical protein